MRIQRPQRAGVTAVVGHHDMPLLPSDYLGNLIEQRRTVDRLGPRLWLWKRNRVPLLAIVRVGVEPSTLVVDQIIEGFDAADAELICHRLALPVVFELRQLR